jgi:Tfp pilus assembly protein PilZ
LLDISPAGCLVESREPLGEVSSTVRLRLPLPKGDAREPLAARIVWKTERGACDRPTGFLYGLRFEEMDPESQKTLRLYLDFLRRDSHVTSLDEAWRKLRSGRSVSG